MATKGKRAKTKAPETVEPLWRKPVLIALLLVLATVIVYLPVFQNELVNYDDDYYITQNPNLRLGLGSEGLHWAFTQSYGANWYPLTWLSYMVDYELNGFSPRWLHGVNLAFHVASVVLLFFVFLRMTGAVGPSAFVAAVFGLHPMHVESVAWAAERKDVLSGFFWILAMWAYARYSEAPKASRYGLVALFLALGLMSKPMVVTLPFALLLLDVWPLQRVSRESWGKLIVEKVPLFLLIALSAIVTFYAQRAEGAVQSLGIYSLATRVENALLAYVAYAVKAFWPTGLAPYYPHPGDTIPLWQAVAALVALLVVTGATLAAARGDRRLSFLPVGWLWFLGTLVPVIGIVQVGQQAMADRYTYLPYIGLSVMVAYGGAALAERVSWPRSLPKLAGGAATLALGVLTVTQVRIWRDSVTLFEHTLAVTENNALAHINLGVAYLNRGRLGEAATQLQEAVRIHPGSAEAYAALGSVRAKEGKSEEALELYRTSLRLEPASVGTHRDFGNLLAKLGDTSQALVHFREAAALSPRDGDTLLDLALTLSQEGRFDEAEERLREAETTSSEPARLQYNWGVVLAAKGDAEAAIERYQRALSLREDYPEAHFALGQVQLRRGDFEGAAAHLREAARLEPRNDEMQYHLGLALVNAGKVDEGFEHFQQALSLNPDRPETYFTLGLTFARLGELERAVEAFQQSLSLAPDNAEAHYSLGLAYAGLGRFQEAIESYQRALAIAPRYAEAHNSWGVALASEGHLDEAVAEFERALELNPGLGQAHNNWGLALAGRGATEAAIEHFRTAVSLEPQNADGYNNLGVSLARQGKLEEAAASFQKAVELAPNHPSARRNLEGALRALQSGKGSPDP